MNVAATPSPEGFAAEVVSTNKARCRDCFRCVRYCPVKAIRMHEGQASVDPARCLACGTCVRQCPQGAKSFRNDVARARTLLVQNAPVLCSLAPSFAAVFPGWRAGRLPSALRRLGFAHVSETGIGAEIVARHTAQSAAEAGPRARICSSCPAVVRYVERYRPELLGALAPVVSPMIAHARWLRRKFGPHVRIVFVGPCVAKKAEAQRPEYHGDVDCVLTFQELSAWLDQEGIDLAACEESQFDAAAGPLGRAFALEGGCLRAAEECADGASTRQPLALSGFENICDAFDGLPRLTEPLLIEPLFCPQGCIGGPGMVGEGGIVARRLALLHHAQKAAAPQAAPPPATHFAPHAARQALAAPNAPAASESAAAPTSAAAASASTSALGWAAGRASDAETPTEPDLPRALCRAEFRCLMPPDEREGDETLLRATLERLGKADPADQLDCGACGYASCREKALAVLRGMAEPEMCLPQMRRLAEQRVDRIIETSPNGIVIVDQQLRILHMNPAFRRFFMCTDSLCGRPISLLMDPEPFERLASGRDDRIERTVDHPKYGLVCHQIIYTLPHEGQYVGIFVNITHLQASRRQLDELRAQTIRQARELLQQQMTMAETIAVCLGENTARAEALLDKLMAAAESSGRERAGTASGAGEASDRPEAPFPAAAQRAAPGSFGPKQFSALPRLGSLAGRNPGPTV